MVQENEKRILIGISAQSIFDISIASDVVSKAMKIPVGDFDSVIIDFMNSLLGTKIKYKDDKLMSAFLGDEWSYTREEKFTENDRIVFKPVKYHLTPKIIFTKLKYNLREIHSRIWVNLFFNKYKESLVVPVLYPNQADAILENGGIIIRINNHRYINPSREEQLMDRYEGCTYHVDMTLSTKQLDELIWKIKKTLLTDDTGK
jgi:hypothetical protein